MRRPRAEQRQSSDGARLHEGCVPGRGRRPTKIERRVVEGLFSVPQPDAARKLGISLTTLKQACRRLGIMRWPYQRHVHESTALTHRSPTMRALSCEVGCAPCRASCEVGCAPCRALSSSSSTSDPECIQSSSSTVGDQDADNMSEEMNGDPSDENMNQTQSVDTKPAWPRWVVVDGVLDADKSHARTSSIRQQAHMAPVASFECASEPSSIKGGSATTCQADRPSNSVAQSTRIASWSIDRELELMLSDDDPHQAHASSGLDGRAESPFVDGWAVPLSVWLRPCADYVTEWSPPYM